MFRLNGISKFPTIELPCCFKDVEFSLTFAWEWPSSWEYSRSQKLLILFVFHGKTLHLYVCFNAYKTKRFADRDYVWKPLKLKTRPIFGTQSLLWAGQSNMRVKGIFMERLHETGWLMSSIALYTAGSRLLESINFLTQNSPVGRANLSRVDSPNINIIQYVCHN